MQILERKHWAGIDHSACFLADWVLVSDVVDRHVVAEQFHLKGVSKGH